MFKRNFGWIVAADVERGRRRAAAVAPLYGRIGATRQARRAERGRKLLITDRKDVS
jgi:hypothetical protein